MTTRFVLIASGPSLTREDCEKVRGERVIVINTSYLLTPWAEILYACDGHWWDWHHNDPEMIAFRGRRITQDADAAKRYGLEYIKGKDAPGLSREPGTIHTGQNSGVQAIGLACQEGATEILLLGYDMQATNGRRHWFGNHPNQEHGEIDHYDSVLRHSFSRPYKSVAEDAEKMGVKILNCSRETSLTCFPRADLDSVL